MSSFLKEGSIRGRDTKTGEAGYCTSCKRHMPEGPDICLGVIPNVSHACCGHDGLSTPYVVIGGLPDQRVGNIPYSRTLYNEDALEWLRAKRESHIGGI